MSDQTARDVIRHALAVQECCEECAQKPHFMAPAADAVLAALSEAGLLREPGDLIPEPCPTCGGSCWVADHAPGCSGGRGCSRTCPVQVQCDRCRGTGKADTVMRFGCERCGDKRVVSGGYDYRGQLFGLVPCPAGCFNIPDPRRIQ